MSEHAARVRWSREGARFLGGQYSRGHVWEFDGGATVAASASPHVVAVPLSIPEAVDPEEAFVAALASCHMLWFLSLAAGAGLVIEDYQDSAVGFLERLEDGGLGMARVHLRPKVVFGGHVRPSADEHLRLHHEAHDRCFLARSVRTEIRCEPTDVTGSS